VSGSSTSSVTTSVSNSPVATGMPPYFYSFKFYLGRIVFNSNNDIMDGVFFIRDTFTYSNLNGVSQSGYPSYTATVLTTALFPGAATWVTPNPLTIP
jgi:hypothetical protein